MECLAFVKFDHFSSNSLTLGPCTSQPDSNGSRTELISASVRFVLEIGIFNGFQGYVFLSSQLAFEDLFVDHTYK